MLIVSQGGSDRKGPEHRDGDLCAGDGVRHAETFAKLGLASRHSVQKETLPL